jgi:hypothetical protein
MMSEGCIECIVHSVYYVVHKQYTVYGTSTVHSYCSVKTTGNEYIERDVFEFTRYWYYDV